MVDVLLHERRFVYGIQSLDLIKIGVTLDIQRRIEDMRLFNPHGCELVFHRRTYAPFLFERKMHELLADRAVGREWFRVTVAELRQAATKAKSLSVSAELALDRSRMKLARDRHAEITS
jgi:hypothetical protein